MNQQLTNTAFATVVRRFTSTVSEALFPMATSRTRQRAIRSSRRSQRSSEMAWGLGLFALAFVTLVWLNVQFGVDIGILD